MSIEDRAYWDKREAELAEAGKVEKLSREEWLSRRAAALTSKLAYSDVNFFAQDIPVWRVELEKVRAELAQITAASRDAEWTREVTQQRREEWNKRARAGEFNERGKVSPLKVRNAEIAQGWRTSELKAAIERHGL